ncbi:MAG: hypothetical protein HWN68_08350 [Desulfobacterales bacterium]|nr:hypothetical protein [Desulfobacterales bacterium]
MRKKAKGFYTDDKKRVRPITSKVPYSQKHLYEPPPKDEKLGFFAKRKHLKDLELQEEVRLAKEELKKYKGTGEGAALAYEHLLAAKYNLAKHRGDKATVVKLAVEMRRHGMYPD